VIATETKFAKDCVPCIAMGQKTLKSVAVQSWEYQILVYKIACLVHLQLAVFNAAKSETVEFRFLFAKN
jgi:hypothetical protein